MATPRKLKTNTPRSFKTAIISVVILFALLLGGGAVTLSHYGIDPILFYSNLANPFMRFVHVPAGLRKEQTVELFAKTLGWKEADKQQFLATAIVNDKDNPEGVFLPGNYWVRSSARGSQVAQQMIDAFNTKVKTDILAKKKTNFNSKINIDTALRMASIIQREAAGPKDMPLVAGVMWNRVFKGMNLEMDATLQYIKGTSTEWWPKVAGSDKRLESPYNTYKYKGLPPTAIANPSIEALSAAYNPSQTNCIFYIHDNNRQFHCAVTYSEHKENIQRYLIGIK